MNSKLLQKNYENNKERFHIYINKIKNNAPADIYSIVNTTLISNTYNTDFPKIFFSNDSRRKKQNLIISFAINSIRFYARNFYAFLSYFVSFLIFKGVYKKKDCVPRFVIDIFFLVDNINRDNKFTESYFSKLYSVLNEKKIDYVFLVRLYGVTKNPFKLIKFFKIINQDSRGFLFEFELIGVKDFFCIFEMVLYYPFKTLRLLQEHNSNDDVLFNYALIQDISKQQFGAFTRYIDGKNIAEIKTILHIYSWSEFQVIERSFNYAIRERNNHIILHGCQFYLNYETYFNSVIKDIDEHHKSAFHEVLVNGDFYIKKMKNVKYRAGVALRYSQVFEYHKKKTGQTVVVLGSFIEQDTRQILLCVSQLGDVLFKPHPTMLIEKFTDVITKNITVVKDNIYKLFDDASIVVGTASGACVEAVACDISVLVIASQDNLTANPLAKVGQGKIWDIAYDKKEVEFKISALIQYRREHEEEMSKISSWYKENFFIEPTEENIVAAFELDRVL